jgi:glycosyltransferase involved in cell wall biosynthesis
MAVYNGEPYVRDAVRSVLDQSMGDFVFIIVDDGSTDTTAGFLDGLSDERVRVFHRPHRGRGEALNFGLDRCETALMAKIDADDLVLSDRLGEQLAFLREHADIGMVGTQFRYFGSGGRCPMVQRLPLKHETIVDDLLAGKLSLVHASLTGKTEVFRKAGRYRITELGLDWDMMIRFSEATRLANLDSCQYLWRLHVGNLGFARMRGGRARVDWACECARRRARSEPEPSIDEFLAAEGRRPPAQRLRKALDVYGIYQYRKALTELVNERRVVGVARLAFAAACAPRRSLARIGRMRRDRRIRSDVPTAGSNEPAAKGRE